MTTPPNGPGGRPAHGAPPVYLDHSATAPLRPEALAAMLPILTQQWGNPSGSHAVARAARDAVDRAREQVASTLGARFGEIVFTSGGTESDNLAVVGAMAGRGGTALCPAAEHDAVLLAIESVGGRVVAVDADGVVDLDALAGSCDASTPLVSVMLVNNEVGSITPIEEVAAVVRARAPGSLLHTDAVQAPDWLDLRPVVACTDLVSLSAHKFGGPKGTGVLVVRDGVRLRPIHHGGGQEHDLRSGTHNVAGIVGTACALAAADAERPAASLRVAALRDRLADGLTALVDGAAETGSRSRKAPGHCHVRFAGVETEELLFMLDELGICASAGSACASGAIEPSHVLLAIGLSDAEARGAVRFTLGPNTTDADIDAALELVPQAVARIRR